MVAVAVLGAVVIKDGCGSGRVGSWGEGARGAGRAGGFRPGKCPARCCALITE